MFAGCFRTASTGSFSKHALWCRFHVRVWRTPLSNWIDTHDRGSSNRLQILPDVCRLFQNSQHKKFFQTCTVMQVPCSCLTKATFQLNWHSRSRLFKSFTNTAWCLLAVSEQPAQKVFPNMHVWCRFLVRVWRTPLSNWIDTHDRDSSNRLQILSDVCWLFQNSQHKSLSKHARVMQVPCSCLTNATFQLNWHSRSGLFISFTNTAWCLQAVSEQPAQEVFPNIHCDAGSLFVFDEGHIPTELTLTIEALQIVYKYCLMFAGCFRTASTKSFSKHARVMQVPCSCLTNATFEIFLTEVTLWSKCHSYFINKPLLKFLWPQIV